MRRRSGSSRTDDTIVGRGPSRYTPAIRFLTHLFVLGLVAIGVVLGGWAVLQSLRKPAIATAPSGGLTFELPGEMQLEISRLPRPRGVDEAAALRDSDELTRATGRLVVDLRTAEDRAFGGAVVVLDGRSHRELGRVTAPGSDRVTFDDIPYGEHEVVAVAAGEHARRGYFAREHVVVRAGETSEGALSVATHTLTVVIPLERQPVVLELRRPDDPDWSRIRQARVTRVDESQEVVFQNVGVGAYILVAHETDELDAETLPLTVVDDAKLTLTNRLR